MKNTASNLNGLGYEDDSEDMIPESGEITTFDPDRSKRFAENQERQDRQKQEDQTDEAKIRKRDQIMATVQQEILMSGVTLGMQEMKDFYDAIVALVETATPEAGRHITAFLERLGQHTQKTSKLRDEGFGGQATVDTVKFLEDELTIIGKISDRHIRDQVTMLLGFAVNPDKLEQEIEGIKNKTLGWTIASFVPGGGLIDLYEAKEGRTMAGEKISAAGRVAKATFGAVTVGMDLSTFGAFSAAKGLVAKVVGTSSTLQKGINFVRASETLGKLKTMLQVKGMAASFATANKISGLLQKCPKLSEYAVKTSIYVVGNSQKIKAAAKGAKYGFKGAKLYNADRTADDRQENIGQSTRKIAQATGNAGAKLAIDHAIKNPHAANDTDESLAA